MSSAQSLAKRILPNIGQCAARARLDYAGLSGYL
jgi:hypothetical protein